MNTTNDRLDTTGGEHRQWNRVRPLDDKSPPSETSGELKSENYVIVFPSEGQSSVWISFNAESEDERSMRQKIRKLLES